MSYFASMILKSLQRSGLIWKMFFPWFRERHSLLLERYKNFVIRVTQVLLVLPSGKFWQRWNIQNIPKIAPCVFWKEFSLGTNCCTKLFTNGTIQKERIRFKEGYVCPFLSKYVWHFRKIRKVNRWTSPGNFFLQALTGFLFFSIGWQSK